MTTTTRARKPAADRANTAVAAPAAEPKATTPEPKPKRVPAKLVPVAGCSLNVKGTVTPCTEHKTYGDPHCRRPECPSWIGACDVHQLQKGGTVVVIEQPVQQAQSKARRTRRTIR